jgi:hypothetical protein
MSMHTLSGWLCVSCVVLLLSSAAQAAGTEHQGRVTLKLQSLGAVDLRGSPYPAKDTDCRVKFGRLLGQTVETEYKIDTKTLHMSADSTFDGMKYWLQALGIAHVYAFAAFFHTSPVRLPLYSVQFTLSPRFTQPFSRLALWLDPQTLCWVSSAPVSPLNAAMPAP